MLYREIIAVCSEIHTKHINTVCGQNVEFVNVRRGGTYSNHWALLDFGIQRIKKLTKEGEKEIIKKLKFQNSR
jgi:hypothetical protein